MTSVALTSTALASVVPPHVSHNESLAHVMLMPVTIPDLGTAGHELRISAWFVETGATVEEGDRLFEVLISGVTCDVSARCAGQLTRIEKNLDALVEPGDVVAWIEG